MGWKVCCRSMHIIIICSERSSVFSYKAHSHLATKKCKYKKYISYSL